MKKILVVFIILLLWLRGYTINYYFSSVSGNDSRTAAQAQNPATPWLTLTKLNSFFTSLAPGDSVLLKRGETFYGQISVTRSGTVGSPIVIGAYSTGNKPIITGLQNMTGWVITTPNVWTSFNGLLSDHVNIVLDDNIQQYIGRFPNLGATAEDGYLMFESSTANSITDNQLLNSPNWIGADAAVRVINYRTEVGRITNHAGTRLTFSQNFSGVPVVGGGFFFQNSLQTLDVNGEYYYNPTSKRLYYYSSTGAPTNVQAAAIGTLIKSVSFSYITFDNLNLVGANDSAFNIGEGTASGGGGTGFLIKNCSINYTGINGISFRNHTNFVIRDDSISNSMNEAIWFNVCPGAIVRRNVINNVYQRAGMGQSGSSGNGVRIPNSSNATIDSNKITNVGYCGILFDGNNIIVNRNYIDTYCNIKNDGGAIYTVPASGVLKTGVQITNNLVLNGIGAQAGGQFPQSILAFGIYLDNNSSNMLVEGNYGAYGDAGIYLHRGHSNTLRLNSMFGFGKQMSIIADDQSSEPVTGIVLRKNIFFSRLNTQRTIIVTTNASGYGSIDSNYYARPIDDNLTLRNISTDISLSMWRTAYPAYDAHSAKSPRTVTNVNQIAFHYNPTLSPINITLVGGWVDVTNTPYNTGSLTLQPFTSIILISTGTVINNPPTASAGIDQTIQLPTSSVSLVGSGSDPGGSIASYAWTKVSGGAATITSPSSASTTITGMVAGVYQFKLTVTDNGGLTGSDNIQITVNAANAPPIANAGTDQAVTLPTSSTTLSGSGSDPDGSITAYLWSRISGPNTPTIVSATSATTSVTGLIAGTYVFRLTVTDNQSLTGTDDMQVIVSASPNVAPSANAGIDQTIQLPTNSVSLSGSGNDPDGTIVAYLWSQISGGAASITSPTTAATAVTGMVAGTYQFKLTVTDNGGLTGSDIVVITVNPANIPPTVNAGTDQTIVSPTSTVTLSGSATDVDGTISSHTWTKTSGTGGTITSASSYSTTVTGLTAGNYVFRLTAIDNQGGTGFDEMNVAVNIAPNVPPTANAGVDQTITIPTQSVSLSGIGTDTDGTIVVYSWTKISGGAATITSASSAATTVTGLNAGVYQFRFTVTDNSGATASDDLQVTVNVGAATMSYSNLTQTYTGLPLAPTITTSPAGLTVVNTLYNGVGGTPIDAGVYSITSGLTNSNYSAPPISGTFTISKASATLTVSNLAQVYNGTQRSVSVVTSPVGLSGVAVTYNGSPTAPTNAGTYAVIVTLTNTNYAATTVNTSLVISKATPTVSWSNPSAITYGTALGGSQLNATASIAGTFAYTPASGTILNAGTQSLSVNFTPTDGTNYNSVNNTIVSLTVNKAVATITITPSTLNQNFDGNPKSVVVTTSPANLLVITTTYNGSTTPPSAVGTYPVISSLSNSNYTATNATGNLVISTSAANIFITNLLQVYTGSQINVTVTSAYSYTLTYNGSATAPTNVGSYTAIATINDGIHTGADTQTLVISKAIPIVTWVNPADITFGTALSGTQLNASANVAGSFAYSPISTTVLNVGNNQILATTFTPTDAANYNTISTTVLINVTGNTATLSLSGLSGTYDGNPKPVTVSSSPSGLSGIIITYNASTTPPTNAGSYAILVSLVNSNYTAPTVAGTLVVSKASPVLSWATPAAIIDGTALSSIQLNPSSNIAGVFSFNYPSGTILPPGTITLVATFTPSDITNYNVTTISVPLSVFGNPFLDYYIRQGHIIYLELP